MKKIKDQKEYQQFTLEAVESFNKKDYADAVFKLNRMAAVNPENIKIHEILCFIYSNQKEPDKAQEEYDIILRLAEEQGLPLKKPKSFEELVREAGDRDALEKKYEAIFSGSGVDMVEATQTAMQLSNLYIAEDEAVKAEAVIQRFKAHYRLS